MILTYVIIFILAAIPFFEVMAIVPIGIIGGLYPLPVVIVAVLGNLLTVTLLIFFIDKVKKWRKKEKSEDTNPTKRQRRAKHIWKKYGLPGLAFIGPFFVGTHLSAFMSLLFGGTRKRTFQWITSSIIAWSLVLGISAYYGFDFFSANEEQIGFITRIIDE